MVLRRRAAALRPHPSTGRWDPGDRAEILAYLASRDEGRCGLCALPLPVAEGQVEHVVPKKFGLFDFSGGSARAGRTLESMLHHVDNLQMAHDYCNRAKGNTPSAVKWRHPMLPSLPVARQVGTPRTYLWVPERDRDRAMPAAPTPAGTTASPSPVGASSETGFRHQARDPRGALRLQRAFCLLGPDLWPAERHSVRCGLDALLGVRLRCCRLASRSAQTSGSRSEIGPRASPPTPLGGERIQLGVVVAVSGRHPCVRRS